MQNENSRNTIIFFVCAALIMGIYYFTVMRPQAEQQRAARIAAAEMTKEAAADPADPTVTGAVNVFKDRAAALTGSGRVAIESGTVKGSLSLLGGRIDDLYLTQYREELGNPAPVELFRPQGTEHAYFAQFGWRGANVPGGVPGPNTVWTLVKGDKLTPTTPVELAWDNGSGLRFSRVISVDDKYLFTVTDTVANLGTQPITIAPYSRVERQGIPDKRREMISHEGAIGTFGDGKSYSTEQIKYKDWAKKTKVEENSTGGWMGITDKYWLAALIPAQDEQVQARFTVRQVGGVDIHEANLLGAAHTVAPGKQITETQRLFAGVKRNEILKQYEEQLALPRFVYAIDWGILWFLTRPIFQVLEFFFGLLGNFGLAILALTVVVKLVLFPLANKSYASMSKMRMLQPKLEELKKKHGKDPQKQQQEMMALYQREKINPLAGCLPILVQIPVFFALYKVLFVTIEMRQAPFFGWIKDLSAKDPTSLWNLFGALPFDPSAAPLIGGILGGPLHLGVLPIIYGLTMWLQMSMNPPAQDPMQRQIFALMPLVFTFIMAPFAAGLLIYWAWNNILSILQQYVIMHKYKAENPIDTFFARFKKA